MKYIFYDKVRYTSLALEVLLYSEWLLWFTA